MSKNQYQNTIFAQINQSNIIINCVEYGIELFMHISQKCNECSNTNINNQSRNSNNNENILMKGWINNKKEPSVMRMFIVNPYGFGPNNEEEVN